MTVESFLYEAFGDSSPIAELSSFQLQVYNFFYGQTAILTLRANLRNKYKHHISSAAPFQLQSLLMLRINQQRHALMATQYIGQLETQFVAVEEIKIELFLEGYLVLCQEKHPVDSFYQCARAYLQGPKITALASSSFYSARSLKNGIGKYKVHVAEPSLLGICMQHQRHVVFGSVLSGVVELICDGKQLTLCYGEGGAETKTIEGIDGEEVVMFIRLKAGRAAEML